MVPGADLSDAAASIAYLIEPIPPRAEAYFVVAVFDDDADGPVPGPNDLLSLPAPFTIDAAGGFSLDIALSMSLP